MSDAGGARPTVSVVIIVFNGEAFLAEAIDSVFAQTFCDYELIIVDDGSTDRTGEIAERYRSRRPEGVRVVRHADGGNHGTGASRNLGIAQARGEFLAFLDADDVWVPEKLAEQVAILRAHPRVGLVYGRARIWRSWSGEGADFFYDLGVAPDRVHAPPRLFRRQLRNVDQTPTTSGSMMRADLVRALGACEPRFGGMFEDAGLFAKLLLWAPAYVSSAVWFNYRQHPGSLCARSAAAGADDEARLKHLDWLADYLAIVGGRAADRAAVLSIARDLRGASLRTRLPGAQRRLAGLWSR
jgi:glycosyltransferase involved in cell wall biosynthesis